MSDDFVPNASDITKTFDTTGLVAAPIEGTSGAFAAHRNAVAQQVLAALDPDNDSVSSGVVVVSAGDPDPEKEAADMKAWAEKVLADAEAAGEHVTPLPEDLPAGDPDPAADSGSADSGSTGDSTGSTDSGSADSGTPAAAKKPVAKRG